MQIIEVIIIGLALSMDAFAVTLANTASGTAGSRARAMAMPIAFGLFQGSMPLIGYFLGSLAAQFISDFAGIIAFVILTIIGGKMAWEGIRELRKDPLAADSSKGEPVSADPGVADLSTNESSAVLSIPTLLAQAVATSIDALIVGVSFLAMDINIFTASSIVAITTFLCCLIALAIGRRFGSLLGDKAQIVGGIVLILIGLKALL
jgi:putative Mn2+ efflux pump MntP